MSTADEIDLPTHTNDSVTTGGSSSTTTAAAAATNNNDSLLDDDNADGDDDDAELEAMKARVAEMEAEAAKLREMQEQADSSMTGVITGPTEEEKEEVDSRSIYVGNVSVQRSRELRSNGRTRPIRI